MSQTSINAAGQPVGYAGQKADNADSDELSRFSEEASAEIAFGLGVQTGTNAQGVKLPSSSADVITGIVLHSFNHLPGTNGDLGTTGLKPNSAIALGVKGRYLVQLDAGVSSITPNVDRGWCRHTTDGSANTIPGRWGKAQDASNNVDCTKQTIFRSGVLTLADGSKGAVLEVDFTNKP